MGVERSRWKERWSNVAWWIVTIYSVPFALYTLPFISGKFEIYKQFTLTANHVGRQHLAGLNILHNLRTWQVMGPSAIVALVISVNAARNKQFQKHRIWILRSTAIGYSVMYTRLVTVLIEQIFKVSLMEAVDYSFLLSLGLNIGLAEIYTQAYLPESDRKRTSKPATESTLIQSSMKKVS